MDTTNKKSIDRELEKLVVDALCARGLKERMQDWEEELRNELSASGASAQDADL